MFLSFSSYGQNDGDADKIFDEGISDITTVLAWAGTGAVLGLSTLSFIDEPWDRKKNILYGFSIGTVIGVAFVAYFHATRSQSDYYDRASLKGPDFSTDMRVSWHQQSFKKYSQLQPNQLYMWSANF